MTGSSVRVGQLRLASMHVPGTGASDRRSHAVSAPFESGRRAYQIPPPANRGDIADVRSRCRFEVRETGFPAQPGKRGHRLDVPRLYAAGRVRATGFLGPRRSVTPRTRPTLGGSRQRSATRKEGQHGQDKWKSSSPLGHAFGPRRPSMVMERSLRTPRRGLPESLNVGWHYVVPWISEFLTRLARPSSSSKATPRSPRPPNPPGRRRTPVIVRRETSGKAGAAGVRGGTRVGSTKCATARSPTRESWGGISAGPRGIGLK